MSETADDDATVDVAAMLSEEEIAWLERRRQTLGAATLSEAIRQIIRDDMERTRGH